MKARPGLKGTEVPAPAKPRESPTALARGSDCTEGKASLKNTSSPLGQKLFLRGKVTFISLYTSAKKSAAFLYDS